MSLYCKSVPFGDGVLHPGLVQSHSPRFTALDVVGTGFLNQQGTGVSTKQSNLYCQMLHVGVLSNAQCWRIANTLMLTYCHLLDVDELSNPRCRHTVKSSMLAYCQISMLTGRSMLAVFMRHHFNQWITMWVQTYWILLLFFTVEIILICKSQSL